jgi:hypothetical protein
VLRPEIAALTMAGSSIIVAANALSLKRLRLAHPDRQGRQAHLTPAKQKEGALAIGRQG